MFGRRKARAAANQQEYAATTGGAPGVDGSGYDAAGGVPAGGGAGEGSDYVQQPQYVNQNGGPLGNNNNNVGMQKPGGYGGVNGYDNNQGYVAGPDGGDNYDPQRKKKNSAANKCAACFVACWACTWPCHGPCCCGL